jgi:hypothetical protein
MNYSMITDEIHSSSCNMSFETLNVIVKLLVYVKIRIPENENDKNFRKEVVRTVVNVEKAMKGAHHSFFVGKIVETFANSCDREIKFPLKKVRNERQLVDQELQFNFQGIFRLTNMTFNDDFIPIRNKFSIFTEYKFLAQAQGSKLKVNFFTGTFVSEFRPNPNMLIRGPGSLEEVIKMLRL